MNALFGFLSSKRRIIRAIFSGAGTEGACDKRRLNRL